MFAERLQVVHADNFGVGHVRKRASHITTHLQTRRSNYNEESNRINSRACMHFLRDGIPNVGVELRR